MYPGLYAMPRFPYGSAHFPAHTRPVFQGYGADDLALLGSAEKKAELERKGYLFLGGGAAAAFTAAFVPMWWLKIPLLGVALYSVKLGFEPLCEAGIMGKTMDELGGTVGGVVGQMLAAARGA